ncbi:MAG: NYN domain-containing protein [Bradymonadales bacterium]|nr:NYN domain-containing protein [Bradymonadales bacterium]
MQRAACFFDGNNFYHSLHEHGVVNLGQLRYDCICAKVAQNRTVVYMGYYVGKLAADAPHYGDQRAFFSRLRKQGLRIVEGRIEKRPAKGELVDSVNSLLTWLTKHIKPKLDLPLYNILREQVSKLATSRVWVEKAVDVEVAVDMLVKAVRDEYDVAYLFSADGDYTPAVREVKALGKTVCAVSLSQGHQLAQVVDTYIRLPSSWFDDCL